MVSLTPLRYIELSGGLFTENLLLKIRDKREEIEEVRWISFGKNWQDEKKRYYEMWEWAKRTFGEIADNVKNWTVKERYEKWIKPLFQKLGHKIIPNSSIDINNLSQEEQDNILNKIFINFKIKNNPRLILQISKESNLDERVDSNYQKKSEHDNLQRYILLKGNISWGFLTDGYKFRLLGEYSNIYAKGYVQFDLENIFIKKDEPEFWLFYAFIHSSRFDETYGLNPSKWIDSLKNKWEKFLEKRKAEGEQLPTLNPISDDILNVYNEVLRNFIEKANAQGIMAINSSDSEIFTKALQEKELDIGVRGRDLYLKNLEEVVSDINKNKTILKRLQDKNQEEGIEIGKALRKNVKKALELMGEGLIQSSPSFANDILKGEINIKEFYQELLRVCYRIIFGFYAESKRFLPGVNSIYYNDLSLTFLRKKAEQPIRADSNIDLWHRLLFLFKYLDVGEYSLGMNAFSGELFDPNNVKLILDKNYNLSLVNSLLLQVIREMTIVDLGIGLQRIDYANIGEEEIGGIYEALLDFKPRYLKRESPTYHFVLEEIDTERKGSGTYYTPKGLIDILLKTALRPVVEKKLEELKTKEEKLEAILDLKICDPACGGGSFLLASLDYLGKVYAQIENESEFPDEKVLRESRRMVLQNCIYGVDLNPMALELAKISLWLKASVKDKPLTFLDNHLKEGNSLIGFAKKQKIENIPSNSFNAVKGNAKTGIPDENKKYVNYAKKRLKDFAIIKVKGEDKGFVQKTLFPFEDSEKYSTTALELFKMDENNIQDIRQKAQCYSKLKESNSWRFLNIEANLWTSSFFWKMDENFIKETPTDSLILNAKKGDLKELSTTLSELNSLSKEYKFFNWYLEFPEIFSNNDPGFDCILMNPPWDIKYLQENEFFAGKADDILNAQNQSERQKKIKQLQENYPDLHKEYVNEYRKIKKNNYYVIKSGNYFLSSLGRINIYANFIERTRQLINQSGKIGCIVLSTILSGKYLTNLFQDLVLNNCIEVVIDFINREKLFPVDSRLQFCLLSFGNPKSLEKPIQMAFNSTNIQKIQNELEYISTNSNILKLNKADFELFNPNSKTSPIFSSSYDYMLVKRAYLRAPILILKSSNNILRNPWKVQIKRFFGSSDDSKFFFTKEKLSEIGAKEIADEDYLIKLIDKDDKYIPLYSGSAIELYDHRYNEVIPKIDRSKKVKSDLVKVPEVKKKDPFYSHIPLYYVRESVALNKFPKNWNHKWFIAYRLISNSTNKRTFICSVIPKVTSNLNLQNMYFEEFLKEIICLIANLSSIPFDYIVRNKISGAITQHMVEQFPIFSPKTYSKKLYKQIFIRAIKLIYNSWHLKELAVDFGVNIDQKPFIWDSNKRAFQRAELDAIFALMYGYGRDELEYIINTFQALKNSELSMFGKFKTKRLVLEAYDRFNSDPELGPLFRLEGVDLEKLKGE